LHIRAAGSVVFIVEQGIHLAKMKNKYIDLVEQTFDFPQDEFRVENGNLIVNEIDMMDIIKQYGTPLKITYLPKITSQIQRAKRMFRNAMSKVGYEGDK
jgi:arginine decarboxylase